MTCELCVRLEVVVAGDDHPPVAELDAGPGPGGVPRPFGPFRGRGDLDRLGPGLSVVGAAWRPRRSACPGSSRRRSAIRGRCPRLWVKRSQTAPVVRSTTGQGFPQVFGPSSQTTCAAEKVCPPSVLRFKSKSMSPVSLRLDFRPSQKASTVPLGVTMTEGMRYVW